MDIMLENQTNPSPDPEESAPAAAENEKSLQINAGKKGSRKSKVRKKYGKAKSAGRRCIASDWVSGQNLEIIKAWKANGLTDSEIEQNIGVAHSTFCSWKKKYPDLSDALKRTRARADAMVESSLFMAATGHIVPLNKQKVMKDGTVVDYIDEFYVEPDTKAMIFYLTNRMPAVYKTIRDGRFDQIDAKTAAGGVVQIVVKNDSLEEQEARAIEEAKKRDEESAAGGEGSPNAD